MPLPFNMHNNNDEFLQF